MNCCPPGGGGNRVNAPGRRLPHMDLPTSLVLLAVLVVGFLISWRRMRRGWRRPALVPPTLGPGVRIRPRHDRRRARPTTRDGALPPGRPHNSITTPQPPPEHLPVRLRQCILSGDEQAFLVGLEHSLGAGYRVFRNVRLDDLFLVTTHRPRYSQVTTSQLQAQLVDYVVVALPTGNPVLAIDASAAPGSLSDPVLTAACASAGLRLIRAMPGQVWSPDRIRAALAADRHHASGHAAHPSSH